jgi:hypothetical protein
MHTETGWEMVASRDIHKFINKYCLIAQNLYSYGCPHVLDRVKGLLSMNRC